MPSEQSAFFKVLKVPDNIKGQQKKGLATMEIMSLNESNRLYVNCLL